MTNTVTTMNGRFKAKYAAKTENAIPRGCPFQEDVAFGPASKLLGEKYVQPVLLTMEHGITYSAADNGAFTLNDAVAAAHKPAEVIGAQVAIQSAVSVEAMARALSEDRAVEGGDLVGEILGNMKDSLAKHVEMSHLWGGVGYVHSGWGVAESSTTGTTSIVLTMKLSDWSPAIWAGTVGMKLALYDDDGSGGIPSTALAGHSSNAVTITAVNLSTRKLTISGDQTELDAVETACAAGDVFVYPKGAKGSQWIGANEVAASTGTLFGIDGATYEGFTGNTYAVGGVPLSFDKILNGLDLPVGRGLEEDMVVYVNHRAWSDIMADQAALRGYDASYNPSEFKNGAKKLKFACQSGMVEIKTHRYMKEGYALGFSKKAFNRIGAQDITFKAPGTDEQFLYHLATSMGLGLRGYTMQALFSPKPSHAVLFTGIVNG